MARKLSTCRECGYYPIASDAPYCPQCGKKDPHPGSLKPLLFVAIIGVVAFAAILNSQQAPAPDPVPKFGGEAQDAVDQQAAVEKAEAEKKRQEAAEWAEIVAEHEKRRTWTSSKGKYKVDAKFGGVADGKVKLILSTDGSTIEVPLEKLSNEDRVWITNQLK